MKRPFAPLAISLCLGISLSHYLKIPFIYPFLSSAAFIILAIFYSKKKIPSHINLYLAVFFLGAALYQISNTLPDNHISNFTSEDERKVFLRGTIVDDPIVTLTFYKADKMSFVLNVNFLKERDAGWKKVTGLVKVDAYKNKEALGFGDEVILEGLLSRPNSLRNPGLFDYSRYLEIKDIRSVLKVKEGFFIGVIGAASPYLIKRMAYNLRHKIGHALDSYFNEPFNGFLKAILIGDRSGLSYSLKEDFIKTGTVHILAISGLHVGLIAALFLFIFAILRVPKRLNLVLTMLSLIFYSLVAGSSPPIIRATIMFSIFVLGSLINRERDILNSLSAAAILILLGNPKELFDPSFQLSFISIAGIVVFAPKIDRLFRVDSARGSGILNRARFYALKSISVSAAAWIGTWPFISLYFNIASPIAVIANILVIPILFAVMIASFLFLCASFISNFFATPMAAILYIMQGALFFINHTLSRLPFSYFRTPSPPIEFAIAYYGLIFLSLMPKAAEFGKIKIYKKHLFIIILLSFNIFIWRDIINFEKAKLKITFLDVGHGDSILIEFPRKGKILIDGGSGGDDDRFDIGRSVIAPYLWNNGIARLDAVIATHFHEDHLGGLLYVLKNFDIGCAIDNGAKAAPDNRIYKRYSRIIKRRKIRRLVVGDGDEIEPLDNARLFILNPAHSMNSINDRRIGGVNPGRDDDILDSNDNSMVLKLVYKNSTILFCGDITYKTMERLASYDGFLKSDILKVPHHGGALGDEGVVKNFFKNVSPEVSVISVGKRGRLQAPLKKTVNILTSLNSSSYETMNNGAIMIFIDADSFEIVPYVK